MSKKAQNPKTRQQDEDLFVRKISDFSRGMNADSNPTALGQGEVVLLDNVIGLKNGYEGRRGTKLFSEVELPKVSILFDSIVVTNNQFVVPFYAATEEYDQYELSVRFGGAGGKFYPFTVQYNSVLNQWDCRAITPTGVMLNHESIHMDIRKRLNASFFDQTNRRMYILMGNDLYASKLTQDSNGVIEFNGVGENIINADGWALINRRGGFSPVDAFSRFFRIGEALFLNNAGGLFRISMDGLRESFYWRTNGHVPSVKPTDAPRSDAWQYGFRYIVTHTAFKGGNLSGDRTTGVIEQETSPREITADSKDYSTVYSAVPPSDTVTLLGGTLPPERLEKLYWRSLGKNSFGFKIGGEIKTCLVDYTNVSSLAEVIKATQGAIDNITSNVRFSVTTDSEKRSRFIIHVLANDGTWRSNPNGIVQSVAYDIPKDPKDRSPLYQQTAHVSYLLDPSTVTIDADQKVILRGLTMYQSSNKPVDAFTHYTVYRTMDISAAEDPLGQLSAFRLVNDQNRFVWAADIPAIHPFTGYFDQKVSEIVVVSGGISKHNIGSNILIGNTGDQIEVEVLAVTERGYRVRKTTETSITYGGWQNDPIPMSVGGTHHAIISRPRGSRALTGFAYGDVGDYVFWEDGSTSIISSVSSDGTRWTIDSNPKYQSCGAVKPKSRNFCDTTSDEVLMSRAKSWPLRTRFFTRLPNTTIGTSIPGFIVCGNRGFGEVYYCSTAKLYDVGYYHAAGQYNDSIKEDIREISDIGSLVIIRTPKSTYTIKSDDMVQGGDPRFNESFFILPDPVLVSPTIGVIADEHTVRIDQTKQLVLTSEPAVRFFNGAEYGENVSRGSVQRSFIDRMFPKAVIAFEPDIGIIMWGSKDPYVGKGNR